MHTVFRRSLLLLPAALAATVLFSIAPAGAQVFSNTTMPIVPITSEELSKLPMTVDAEYTHVTGANGLTGKIEEHVGSAGMRVGGQVGILKYSNSGPTGFGAGVALSDPLKTLSHNSTTDVAVGLGGVAGFTHASSDGVSESSFGVRGLGMIGGSTRFGSGQVLWGQAGLGIDVVHTSAGDFSDTSTGAALDLGAGFGITKQIQVEGEFNHDFANGGGDEVAAGVKFLLGAK